MHGQLTDSIIGAFYEVYNALGFGFLEHVYVAALERELRERGHQVGREVTVTVLYKGQPVATQRLDMVIGGCVIVEVKSGSSLHRSASRQLYNYLKSTKLEVGLLLHFGPQPVFYRLISSNSW